MQQGLGGFQKIYFGYQVTIGGPDIFGFHLGNKVFFGDWYNTHVIELRIFCSKIYFRQKLRFCKDKTGL